MPASNRKRQAFLNLPYDGKHEQLYLAFIAGLSAFGLIPRATLELGSSRRRLDKILGLIEGCNYSFHDLSRVEIDQKPPPTQRFNMPFELGMTIATAKGRRHQWFVFEAISHRLNKSLSDLDGTDPQIHEGKAEGVLRTLGNVLSRSAIRPSPADLKRIYEDLKRAAVTVKKERGGSLFEAGAFQDLVVLARRLAGMRIASLTR